MRHLLFFLLVATILTGCGVFGSDDNSSSPEWVGDWRVTEDFTGEAPDRETYWTYSEDQFRVVEDATDSGCDIFIYDILKVDGDDVTILFGAEPSTSRLTVSNGTLTDRIIRSNNPEIEDETARATSVEDGPRKLLGCESAKSATVKNGLPPSREGR